MSRIFWDTNLFIYLIEDAGERGGQVAELRRRMLERGDELVTSALTLGEVLVKPLEMQSPELHLQYAQAIRSGSRVLPFDVTAGVRYAEIRSDHSIRPPDAIQLACASVATVDLFITNDDRLSRKQVPGIQFIQPLERAFV